MEKLQDLEDEMNKFFESHRGSAGAGLVLLPGVHQLLSALKVGISLLSFILTMRLRVVWTGRVHAGRVGFTAPECNPQLKVAQCTSKLFLSPGVSFPPS